VPGSGSCSRMTLEWRNAPPLPGGKSLWIFSLLSGTPKNRKIRRPGTDFRHVASRHHAIDLVQVVQVVHRPRSEKLAQCHDAKGRVRACEIQLRASQSQASQIPEVARAKIRKFTQQINDRLPLAVSELCEAIEGRERDGGSVLENDVHARHPIGLFAVDEVSDAIERTPVFRIILAVNPRLRQVSELVVQDFRRARKNRDAFGKEESFVPSSLCSRMRSQRYLD